MQSRFILSALCIALLSACNSDGPSLLDDEKGRPGFLGTDNSKKPLPPVDRDNKVPPVTIFVNTGEIGQQTSPSVAAIDNNNNGLVESSDSVSFNQPSIVSTFCDSSATACERLSAIKSSSEEGQKQIADARSTLADEKAKLATAQANEAAAKKALDAAKKANNPTAITVATGNYAAAQKNTASAQQAVDKQEAELKRLVDNFNQSGTPVHVSKGIVMLDVNGDFHTAVLSNTIDQSHLPTTVQRDAGITKIDRQRTQESGKSSVIYKGGSIGREFNEVVVFSQDQSKFNQDGSVNNALYLDSYFRAPSTAGWRFQTFGTFHNDNLHNLRNLNVGYQSVGNPTPTTGMAEAEKHGGHAVYEGIAHAYYNSDQVTMRNRIVANFGKRELTYETTGAAIYHTFEDESGVRGTKGNVHVIEERPDLNLTGKATWQKSTSEFEGQIHAANGLNGRIEGRFYGPNVDEVGGVFGLEGEQKNQHVQYVGGFGASRK